MDWKGKINFETRPQVTGDDVILTEKNGEINAETLKETPSDSDVLLIEDSDASYSKKKVTVDSVKGVNIKDNGTLVDGSPFNVLNIIGTTITPDGTTQVTIDHGETVAAVQVSWQNATGVLFDKDVGWILIDQYDTVDVETDDTRISWDSTNSERITVHENATYHIGFFAEGEAAGDTGCGFRIRVNGVVVRTVEAYFDAQSVNDTWTNSFLANLNADDYIDIESDPTGQNITFKKFTFYCYRITSGRDGANGDTGPEGPQGPPGSGNTVNVYEEGVSVEGSPFEVINFIGPSVTATQGDTTSHVDVTISGAILQVDRANLTNVVTTTTTILEATTPTSTSGVAFGSNSITLQKSDSTVRVQIAIPYANDNDAGRGVALIHRGTTVLAVSAFLGKKDGLGCIVFDFYETPGSVGPHTYSIRVGVSTNTGQFNRSTGDATPYGGTLLTNNCWLTLTEIAA